MRAADSTQTNPQQRKLLRVCRIGRAQGLKGEVNVRLFTDDPEHRFTPGSTLLARDGRQFVVLKSRNYKSRWIVLFEGVTDRNASEALNGIDLFIEKERVSDPTPTPESKHHEEISANDNSDTLHEPSKSDENTENEGWYLDDLVGLEVLQVDDPQAARAADYDGVEAHPIGTVSSVINNAAQDLLELRLDNGRKPLIPFVEQIVPIVDIDEGYILIDPPAGLLDL
ncbi:ribosome maturation factor RimM [Alloscardovia theropitheci]|uniref:Ribosome maturation factor RimM n=1 Tax=Alloscardovia theropitheci TaxID=2496842 RepID=A0A4R0QYH9_9BIFI|nr:ribosome maturation factor RimM [Alloscardovia theropitheci]TCD54681.1 ribosome maturation factor RimM [Alloscardovia theropitheci]